MTKPKRIQMRRTKGWRKPENAVYVGRPTKWGNPFTIQSALSAGFPRSLCPSLVVLAFRGWLAEPLDAEHDLQSERQAILDNVAELRGKDLGCWCPLDQPCHADVLLEIANKEDPKCP